MTDADWRLTGQERWLTGRHWRWSTWASERDEWDHDHCDFCWAEISDRPIDEHTAYNTAWMTVDTPEAWVCPPCFEDFRQRFGWSVDEPSQ